MPSPKGRKLSNSPSTPGGPNQNGPSNNQAAFINKLYSMLEDQNVQQLIYWDPSGTYFIVNNITEFSKSVLPQYFKHNNFASFVRQLNMYGFHKINDMFHSNSSDVWEFKHPDFRRGEVELLQSIKRKATKTSTLSKSMADMTSDEKIIHLTNRVEELEQKLAKIHESYTMVWSETCSARALQSKHHQVISSLTAYLATTYDDRDPEKAAKRRKIDVDNLMNEVGKMPLPNTHLHLPPPMLQHPSIPPTTTATPNPASMLPSPQSAETEYPPQQVWSTVTMGQRQEPIEGMGMVMTGPPGQIYRGEDEYYQRGENRKRARVE